MHLEIREGTRPEDTLRRRAEPGMVFPVWIRPSVDFVVYDSDFVARVPHDPDEYIDWEALNITSFDACKRWERLNDGAAAREINFILISSNRNGGFFIPAERPMFVSMNWYFLTENLLANAFVELNGLRNG